MKHTLIAHLAPAPQENAKQPSTPVVLFMQLVLRDAGALRTVITARTYARPGADGMSTLRACVWLFPPRGSAIGFRSGRGSATGCGYHKESEALASAFDSAGVTFTGEPEKIRRQGDAPVDRKKTFYFGGTGESCYEPVFIATARAMGYRIVKGGYLLMRN